MEEFEKLYERYKQAINHQSNGILTTDKEEFLRMITFWQIMETERLKIQPTFDGKAIKDMVMQSRRKSENFGGRISHD